jgi:hypothetical protein
MSLSGKRFIVLLIVVVLIMTGLGTSLMAQATQSAAPTSAGLVSAPSVLDVPCDVTGGWSVPWPSGAPPRSHLEVLILQLEEAWGKSEWDRCITVLTAIVSIDPANALMCERLYQAHVNYGWLLLCRQRFEDSHKQFTLALQVQPNGHEALEGLRLVQQLYVPPAPVCPPAQAIVCTPTPCPVACFPDSPSTSLPAVAVVAPRVHVVQRGDTLFRLALRFNSSVALIMRANGLETTTIKVGQKLTIP